MNLLLRVQAFCALLVLFSLSAWANASEPDHAEKATYSLPEVNLSVLQEAVLHAPKGKPVITAMGKLGEFYVDWDGNYTAADSVLNAAIDMAELSYDNTWLVEAYANYLLTIDDYHYSERFSQVVAALESVSPQLQAPADIWKCKLGLAKGYQMLFNMDQASNYAYQALTRAIQMKDQEKTAESHLVLGNIKHEMNDNVEAVRNFLDALTIAENIKNMELRMKCYDALSNFYNLIKAYDKSIQYKLNELSIAENASNPDSIRIMSLKFDMEVIAFNNRTLNEKQLYNIIDFADRNHVTKLKRYSLIAFRNHLIKQNDFAQLYRLFHEEYPEELEYIRVNDTTMYYRLEAQFCEFHGQLDSAKLFYDMAANRINASTDKLRQASFYLRYGDFLQRSQMPAEAIDKFMIAYTLSSSVSYFEFMAEAADKLEKMYVVQGDYNNAYQYSNLSRSVTDSMRAISQKEQLQLIELENEEVLREQRIQQAADEMRRRNNIQYTAITVLIATAFLLLVILGGFKVPPILIRSIGFVSFILFFEFLVLLFDTWIHHLTGGEPWKVLGIKIILMCCLVPLHHFIEKRVIHFLIHKKKPWLTRKEVAVATAKETNSEIL